MSNGMMRIVPLALVGMLLSGCDPTMMPGAGNENDNTNGTGGGQPDTAGALVNVTALTSPLLSRLADDFQTVGGDDFALDDFEGVKDAITDAALIVADASELTPETADANPIFDAAIEVNKPIVLDNVDDPEVVAAIAGVGLGPPEANVTDGMSDAAMKIRQSDEPLTILVEPTDDGREILITVLGTSGNNMLDPSVNEQDEPSPEDIPEQPEDGDVPEDPDLGEGPKTEDDVASTLDADAILDADAKADLIEERIADPGIAAKVIARAKAQADKTLQTVPEGVVFKAWTVDFSSAGGRWSPGDKNQGTYIEIDFRIELFDSLEPDNKFVRITTIGPGVSPGSLNWNSSNDRGYFQDRIEVEFGPTSDRSGWSVEDHSPQNANNVTSLSSTTGFEVGFSAGADASGPMGGVTGSYSASKTVLTNLTDFRVTNETNTLRGRWDFELSQAGGAAYNRWQDLFEGGCEPTVRGLPTLATAVLRPNSQVVWRAPGNEQGTVPFRFWQRQRVRDTWISNKDWFICVVSYDQHTRWYTWTRWWDPFYIDMGSVNAN